MATLDRNVDEEYECDSPGRSAKAKRTTTLNEDGIGMVLESLELTEVYLSST